MTIARSSILKGPGFITFAGATFGDQDGIDCSLDVSRQDVNVSVFGSVDSRVGNVKLKTSFKPVGGFSDIIAAFWNAYMTPNIGGSIFGASDAPLVIQGKNGQKVTISNAACTRPPDMILSARKMAFGQAELTGILKDNTAPTAAGAYYAVAANAYAAPTLELSDVYAGAVNATWNSITVTASDGWTLSCSPQLRDIEVDDLGTVDIMLTGCEIMAKCRPVNMTETQIMANLLTGGIGDSVRQTKDLVIEAANAGTITLNDAALVQGPLRWGMTDLRAGEIAFVANINTTSGVLMSIA